MRDTLHFCCALFSLGKLGTDGAGLLALGFETALYASKQRSCVVQNVYDIALVNFADARLQPVRYARRSK
jgi:hypothetical protein